MAPLVVLFAFASALCFFAHGAGHAWGLGFGLGCAVVAALLIPAVQGLPGL